MVVAKPDVLVT